MKIAMSLDESVNDYFDERGNLTQSLGQTACHS